MTTPNLVQETHIEDILAQHLWPEIILIEEKLELLKKHTDALIMRRHMLVKGAEVFYIKDPREDESKT